MFGNDFMVPTIVRSLTILNCPSSQLLHPSGSMPFYYYFLEPSPSIPSSLYSSIPFVNQSHLQLPIHCLPYRIQDILKGKEAKATFSQSRYRSCFNNFILLLFLTSKFQSTSAYVIRLIKKTIWFLNLHNNFYKILSSSITKQFIQLFKCHVKIFWCPTGI